MTDSRPAPQPEPREALPLTVKEEALVRRTFTMPSWPVPQLLATIDALRHERPDVATPAPDTGAKFTAPVRKDRLPTHRGNPLGPAPDTGAEERRVELDSRLRVALHALFAAFPVENGGHYEMCSTIRYPGSYIEPPDPCTCGGAEVQTVRLALSERGYTIVASDRLAGLEELRALSEAATPGPWFLREYRHGGGRWSDHATDRILIADFYGRDTEPIGADRDFIVAAVNYVRAALSRSEATEKGAPRE